MAKISKVLFITLELLGYIALAFCLFVIFNLVFLGQADYFPADIVSKYMFAGVLTALGLLGILLGLRRIHHIKTNRLRSKGRSDEVEKLRFFLRRHSKYIAIAVILVGTVSLVSLS